MLLGALASLAADGADYPVRTVRMVVPFAAGGSTDLLARNIAQRLNEAWKQPVIVDNRAGGGGIVGSEFVVKSAPDGYTLLMGTVTTHAVSVSLYRKLPFDPQRDFTPIIEIAHIPQMLSVHPSIPVRSVKEMVALARARPSELNYGTAGSGSASHMAMEYFQSMAKIKMVHVPYKGTGPALIELLGGHLAMMFDVIMTSLPARAVRQAAHARHKRPQALADHARRADDRGIGLPGLRSHGLVRVFRARRHAPRRGPQDQRGNGALVAVAQNARDPRFARAGGRGGHPGRASRKRVATEIAKWRKVIQEAGIKLDY